MSRLPYSWCASLNPFDENTFDWLVSLFPEQASQELCIKSMQYLNEQGEKSKRKEQNTILHKKTGDIFFSMYVGAVFMVLLLRKDLLYGEANRFCYMSDWNGKYDIWIQE